MLQNNCDGDPIILLGSSSDPCMFSILVTCWGQRSPLDHLFLNLGSRIIQYIFTALSMWKIIIIEKYLDLHVVFYQQFDNVVIMNI